MTLDEEFEIAVADWQLTVTNKAPYDERERAWIKYCDVRDRRLGLIPRTYKLVEPKFYAMAEAS